MELLKDYCISCTYLCWNGGNTLADCDIINTSTRNEIIAGTWVVANYQYLRCYKELKIPKELENNIKEATCPSKDWQEYKEGKTPQMCFQKEQSQRQLCWIKIGIVVTLIGIAISIIITKC